MTEETNQNNETKAYNRQETEPLKQYEWFHCYLMLGASRSLLSAFKIHQEKAGKSPKKKPVDAPGSWKDAAATYQWKERASVWDAEQRKIVEKQYEEKRDSLLKKRVDLAEQLLEKAEMMLRFPLVTTKNAGQTTIIEPGKWTFDTAARLAAAADKLLEENSETTIQVTERHGSESKYPDGADADTRRATAIVAILDRGRARRDGSSD